MCDLICDIMTCCVWSYHIQVKSTHLIKSCLKTRKRENVETNDILLHISLYLVLVTGHVRQTKRASCLVNFVTYVTHDSVYLI